MGRPQFFQGTEQPGDASARQRNESSISLASGLTATANGGSITNIPPEGSLYEVEEDVRLFDITWAYEGGKVPSDTNNVKLYLEFQRLAADIENRVIEVPLHGRGRIRLDSPVFMSDNGDGSNPDRVGYRITNNDSNDIQVSLRVGEFIEK